MRQPAQLKRSDILSWTWGPLKETLPILADAAAGARVYVIDELDRKLHTLLSRLFVTTFLGRCQPEQPSQLIFTTHDTRLMDLDLLRRDKLWFLDKNEFGEASLYSLADLKLRGDLKIDKGYLQGRFGGIPLIEPLPSDAQPC